MAKKKKVKKKAALSRKPSGAKKPAKRNAKVVKKKVKTAQEVPAEPEQLELDDAFEDLTAEDAHEIDYDNDNDGNGNAY